MIGQLPGELAWRGFSYGRLEVVAVHTQHCPRASADTQRPTHRLKATGQGDGPRTMGRYEAAEDTRAAGAVGVAGTTTGSLQLELQGYAVGMNGAGM